MDASTTQALLFWPVIITALATLFLYVPMSRARVKSVKSGEVRGSVYKLNVGEPEESMKFNNAIRNQYEVPVLFYAVCIAAHVTGGAGILFIVLAWIFAISKLCHIYIQTGSNELRHRRPMFMVSWATLIVMWLVFAVHVSGLFPG